MNLTGWIDKQSITTLLLYGALLRCIVLVYSIFHDYAFRVKYTDIDYMIVVDGAKEMLQGGTPFQRTTYRYTPLLAALVLPAALIANPLGKIVFALSDIGAAYYCYNVLCGFSTERSAKQMVMLFILFNPVVLNVSTRGNSDMLISFMTMGVLAKFSEHRYSLAALLLGFAVHFKIYPVIYALPLVLQVWEQARGPSTLYRVMKAFTTVLKCGIYFFIGFGIPTFLCYLLYGQQYLDEAFIYHVHREDHRHNFSPYWLLMYLNMGRRSLGLGSDYAPGLVAFLPQFVVLLFASWRLRRNIAHACCVETVLFVAFNKVCTVQYFVWFIPFLAFVFCDQRPVGSGTVALGGSCGGSTSVWSVVAVLLLWASTIPLWVWTAYPLEFEGQNHYGRLWIVSLIFFFATVGLAAWLGRLCFRAQRLAIVGKANRKLV